MSSLNTDEKYYHGNGLVCFKSSWPSQWHKSSFILDDITYNCCEQRMMHMKALLFEDHENAELILNQEEPKEQKKLGRLVKNFDEDIWNKIADSIVYEANLAKFSQNQDLKDLLLATNDDEIIEASPYDNIWGNGLNITDTLKTPKDQWKGENRLGKALMKVRNTLRN
jgi:ribA/ribD-fused uncharacterized protein